MFPSHSAVAEAADEVSSEADHLLPGSLPTLSENNSMPSTVQIRSENVSLIEGMNKLYPAFITMEYVPPKSVQRPPHPTPQTPLDNSKLQTGGFPAEVIALLHDLPFSTNKVQYRYAFFDEKFPVAPDSAAVSCFVHANDGIEGNEHWRDASWETEFQAEA